MKKLLLVLVLVLSVACQESNKIPDTFDYGTIENGVYINDFFNLRMPFKTSWNVQTRQELDALGENAEEFVKSEAVKDIIRTADVTSANLFCAYKFEPETVEIYNPSIILVAENIKSSPQLKRGSDYLKEARKLLEDSTLNYEFDTSSEPIELGGKQFDVLKVTGHYLDNTFYQQYISTIDQGFSLSVIISYANDSQRQELETLMKGISFTGGKSKKKG